MSFIVAPQPTALEVLLEVFGRKPKFRPPVVY